MIKKQKQGINPIDFFCIGFGAIVGVGWAVSINSWMGLCGGPVPAAIGYIAVLLLLVPIALCYSELVPMLPVAGGEMAFSYKAFGKEVAMISGWAAFGAFASIIPWEAIQVTDVLGYLFPEIKSGHVLYTVLGSDIYLSTILIGALCSVFLFLLNMRGMSAAVKLQRFLCFFLVVAALVGAIASLIGGKIRNLTPVYESFYLTASSMPSHTTIFGGIFAMFAMAPFFLTGFEAIPQGIEDAGGNIKSVGKSVVFSIVFAAVFYAFLLLCYGYGWNWQDFIGMERPAAASMMMFLYPGTTGKVLYWIIVLGAIAGLLTSWNGFFMAAARLIMSMGRGRLVPVVFARQNKKGIPVPGLVFCLVLSIAGPFAGPNLIDSMTCFTSVAIVLSWTLTCWALIRLRKTAPELNRPYKIPGGIVMGVVAALIASVVFVCMLIPASPFYVGVISLKLFAIWMVIGLLFYILSSVQRRGLSLEQLRSGVFRDLND